MKGHIYNFNMFFYVLLFQTAKFVDDNKAALFQRVSEVMAIVDKLGDMVHSETYSVILSKQTSQDQMRELFLRTLRSGGVVVKAAFYDILKKDHASLVKSLGKSCCC